jgi:hypothetical protein
MITKLLLITCIVSVCGRLSAQTNVWEPSPGHKQVPIWPEPFLTRSRSQDRRRFDPGRIGSLPTNRFVFVVNVSQPTMTVYSPKGTNRA